MAEQQRHHFVIRGAKQSMDYYKSRLPRWARNDRRYHRFYFYKINHLLWGTDQLDGFILYFSQARYCVIARYEAISINDLFFFQKRTKKLKTTPYLLII
jgi:hypothetical protein